MGDVVDLDCVTTLDMDVDRLLEKAKNGGLVEVVIVGVDGNGNEFFASSKSDAAQAAYHLDRAKWNLFKQVDGLDDEL